MQILAARLPNRLAKLALALSVMVLLTVPAVASAGAPIHAVRGHGILTNEGPAYLNQLSINASVDENGTVTGMGLWATQNLNPPDCPPSLCTGMIWQLRIDSLHVTGNVAHIEATVLRDSRFPEYEGCKVEWTITDRGNGKSGLPDLYEQSSSTGCLSDGTVSILGGDYSVK